MIQMGTNEDYLEMRKKEDLDFYHNTHDNCDGIVEFNFNGAFDDALKGRRSKYSGGSDYCINFYDQYSFDHYCSEYEDQYKEWFKDKYTFQKTDDLLEKWELYRKPLPVAHALSAFFSLPDDIVMTRTELLTLMYAYISEHQLVCEENPDMVNIDEALATLFGIPIKQVWRYEFDTLIDNVFDEERATKERAIEAEKWRVLKEEAEKRRLQEEEAETQRVMNQYWKRFPNQQPLPIAVKLAAFLGRKVGDRISRNEAYNIIHTHLHDKCKQINVYGKLCFVPDEPLQTLLDLQSGIVINPSGITPQLLQHLFVY